MTNVLLQPDNRNRIPLTGYVDKETWYEISTDTHGRIILTPIAAMLSNEQLEDLKADPQGFAAMLERSNEVTTGTVETVPVENIFK